MNLSTERWAVPLGPLLVGHEAIQWAHFQEALGWPPLWTSSFLSLLLVSDYRMLIQLSDAYCISAMASRGARIGKISFFIFYRRIVRITEVFSIAVALSWFVFWRTMCIFRPISAEMARWGRHRRRFRGTLPVGSSRNIFTRGKAEFICSQKP